MSTHSSISDQGLTLEDFSVSDEVAATMRRIRKMAPDRAVSRQREETVAIAEALVKSKYPRRHRESLGGMYGPSLEKAKELLPRVLADDCLIILFGERGPGKTQMATWLAAQRVKAGRSSGVYAKCADIFEEIKRTWADGGKSVGTEHDVLQRYRTTQFLVIDEVHEISGAKSDWNQRVLINILDHRYDARRATILIANFAEDKLEDEINPSILSRAVETGGSVNCDWPSYRKPQS